MRVIDISDPYHPRSIGSHNTLGWAFGLAVVRNTLYVADAFKGLRVLDVSNPKNLFVKGSFKCESSFSEDITVVGDKAYVAEYHLMHVFDISNPANPKELGFLDTQGQAYGIAVDKNVAFVANESSGIAVVDVSNPGHLRLVSEYNTPGFSQKVKIRGKYIYVADGDAGLIILEILPTGSARASTAYSYNEPLRDGFHTMIVRSLTIKEFSGRLSASNNSLFKKTGIVDSAFHSSRTLVVTKKTDSGPGSLRWCLENAKKGDVITFDSSVFPPNKPATILLSAPLPAITQGTITIDAREAGVILNGKRLSAEYADGIIIDSGGNTIRGLQIFNFPASGIGIWSRNQNVIGGDRTIGKGPTGQGNVISGNISGNNFGIGLTGSDFNFIAGNLVGMSADSASPLHKKYAGIQSDQKTYYNALCHNIISDKSAVLLQGDNNYVRGNIITKVNRGFYVSGSSNLIFLNKFIENQTQAAEASP